MSGIGEGEATVSMLKSGVCRVPATELEVEEAEFGELGPVGESGAETCIGTD